MTNKKKNEIATRQPTGFAIVDDREAQATMKAAFDALGMTKESLNRIKVPAGGMTAWEVEELDGTNVHQSLDVIIVDMKGQQKAWWDSSMEDGGGGSPPTCVSTDGIVGIGRNSLDPAAVDGKHRCNECAWNKFESSRSGGKGKDCKDFALLFFFRQGSRIPTMLQVPATSLKDLRNYVLKLVDSGKRFEGVVTRLGLKKTQSAGGITYASLDMSFVSDLDEESRSEMIQTGKEFKKRIETFDAFDDATSDN